MGKLKNKSIAALAEGISRFEDSRNAVKHSDFTDLKTFMSNFLNAPDKKQRRKLAEEFRKRHMELYQFLKDNAELISAETEISRIVNAAINGENVEADTKQLSNLLAMMEESMHGIQ